MSVTLDDIRRARERIAGAVVETPLAKSHTLSSQLGADIHLKFENQQFTASFKERGALNRLLLLSETEKTRGVVAMSAGNHAQALAYHGRRLGVPVSIVMPRSTPNAKVQATRVFGAEVVLHGNTLAETYAHTQRLSQRRDLTLVHPFDDYGVIAGQGTLGLELVEQAGDLESLIVPVGGGGLIAGTATAVKALRPAVRIVGVQAERFAGAADWFNHRQAGATQAGTVAEGIAVERPGHLTMPLMRESVDAVVTVSERQIEDAVFALLEVEKTVTEGAGAAALAAVCSDPSLAQGKTVLVLTGGNIDMMILSSVLQRGLVRSRRLVRISVELPDLPGALAKLATRIGDLDSNIVEVVHHRAFGVSTVRSTRAELVLQMRGEEQIDELLGALEEAGYEAFLI